MSETYERKGEIVKGPITFELSQADIESIKSGSRTVSPSSIKIGNKGFAIRNHAFSDEIITLFSEK